MKKVLYLISFFMSCALYAQPQRVPARRDPIVRVQPNGDSLTVLLRGDEWRHWMMTADGWHIRENKKGVLCYMRSLGGVEQEVSNRHAHDADKRSCCEKRWLKKHGVQNLSYAPCPPRIAPNATPMEAAAIRAKYGTKPHTAAMQVNVRKTFPKVAVILVNFSNLVFANDHIRTAIDSMFNAVDYVNPFGEHSGSVRQYFSDQSYGQYKPQFDIYGPVTVSEDYQYYGTNSYGSSDARPGYLVTEACALMNDSLDFSQYDIDQDGDADLIYILYAGPPASDEYYINKNWIPDPQNLIWPHYSTIDRIGCGTNVRTFDNVRINDYEVSSELDGYFSFQPNTDSVAVAAGIGIPCHEFGHGIGLPDQYNTNNGNNTNFSWDIMDYGCYNGDTYTPAGYSAYERWFMGWLTPRQLTDPENCILPSIMQDSVALLICPSSEHNLDGQNPSPRSFYLLENRQQEKWDTYLDGHGMILTQINYNASRWANNQPNNFSPLGIDIIEADGVSMSINQGSKATDAFPKGATFYKGIENFPIENIQESNGIITFKFKGGTETGLVQQVETNQQSKIILNGQLYLHKSGRWYNLLGHEVHLL